MKEGATVTELTVEPPPEGEAVEELEEGAAEEAPGEIVMPEEEGGGAPSIAPTLGAASPDIIPGKYPIGAIFCQRKTNYPHKSTHDGTTANIIVTLECEVEGADSVRTKAPVQVVHLTAELWYNHHLVSSSGPVEAGLKAVSKANAATPCRSGEYQGWGGAKWYYPAGYANTKNGTPLGTSYGWSPAIKIKC